MMLSTEILILSTEVLQEKLRPVLGDVAGVFTIEDGRSLVANGKKIMSARMFRNEEETSKRVLLKRYINTILTAFNEPEECIRYLSYEPKSSKELLEEDDDYFFSQLYTNGMYTEITVRVRAFKALQEFKA